MTSLNENFESPVLSGYRQIGDWTKYSVNHKDLRFMKQEGETSKVPLHFLSRFSMSELADATASNATPVSDLAFNQRRPGDQWTSTTGSVAEESIPGLSRSIKFVCSTADAVNEFVSTINRPFFAYPMEPDHYEVDLSGYTATDLLYMTLTRIDSGIDLSQSWIMLSSVPNASLSSTSWKMASLGGATISKGRHITLPLSSFSSIPSPVASVRLSFRRTSSGSPAPSICVSELGVRKVSAAWRPMRVNTLSESLVRSAAAVNGDVLGARPLNQPQMIWANSDNSRILTLGGVTTADFNSGSLPSSESGAVRFLGGDSVVTPTFNANVTHEMSGNFSISCWVQLQQDSFNANRTMGIVSKYVEPWDDAQESYGPGYGSYRLGVNVDGNVVFQLGDDTHTSNTELEPDTWYHIVVVRSGTNLRFYLNGELQTNVTVSAAVDTDNSAPFAMATWSTGS